MKYIVVVGGTMSGLGKGITASSIGVILQSLGQKVTFIKIDPYINVDAGNLSPYDHGEVFVLNDGTEVDLDFGNYERFLGIHLTKVHSITTGKVYREIIERERSGKYLGKTVQIVPHLTDLICEHILEAAHTPLENIIDKTNNISVAYDKQNKSTDGLINPDVCIIEVGGTVGDIESLIFVEALRQLKLKVGKENFITVSVNYLPVLESGEQKTKPVQSSVKQSIMHGLKPDIIVCRSSNNISGPIKRKISIFCEVAEDGIFYSETTKNVFNLPFIFESQGMAQKIISCLKLQSTSLMSDLKNHFFDSNDLNNRNRHTSIAIIAKYGLDDDCYMSIVKAIEFSGIKLKTHVDLQWIDATTLENDQSIVVERLSKCNGVIIPGGFGIRGVNGKIAAIKYCRENNIPVLGICLGFQLMAIEFCRHVLGIKSATSEEFVGSSEKRNVDRIQHLFDEKVKMNNKDGANQINNDSNLINNDNTLIDNNLIDNDNTLIDNTLINGVNTQKNVLINNDNNKLNGERYFFRFKREHFSRKFW
ncbi:CTP synthase [Dictyocoela muelleri]|nr:CTP synthase [Dictyocoela muelleri]